MAGQSQCGLRYASIPSTFFDNDPRIDKLLDAQGWRGAGVYMYLLLRAYGSHGYYTEWRYADCATTARKMGGGIGAVNVEEAIRCCTQVGLFDKRLLELWGVLTNIDIQQNYLEAVKRARRKPQIKAEYWLLADETLRNGPVPCAKNAGECSRNAHECNKDEQKCSKDASGIVCVYNSITTTTTTSGKLESGAQHDPLLLSSEEIEERKKKYGPAINRWEQVIARALSSYELSRVCELADSFGGPWVVDAMDIAGDAGKGSLRYVKGILTNWRADGREAKKAAESDEDIRARLLSGMRGGNGNGGK